MFKVNMFYVRWFNKGLVYIDDLLDENNAVLSLPDVNEKFDIRVPFTTYYSIVRTVRANIGQLKPCSDSETYYSQIFEYNSEWQKRL